MNRAIAPANSFPESEVDSCGKVVKAAVDDW